MKIIKQKQICTFAGGRLWDALFTDSFDFRYEVVYELFVQLQECVSLELVGWELYLQHWLPGIRRRQSRETSFCLYSWEHDVLLKTVDSFPELHLFIVGIFDNDEVSRGAFLYKLIMKR